MSYRHPWNLEPCGTESAYKRHLRRGEPTDAACRAANNAAARRRYHAPSSLRGDRAEDYVFLRSCGAAPLEAARRAGIRSAVTIARYERAYQAQREDARTETTRRSA